MDLAINEPGAFAHLQQALQECSSSTDFSLLVEAVL